MPADREYSAQSGHAPHIHILEKSRSVHAAFPVEQYIPGTAAGGGIIFIGLPLIIAILSLAHLELACTGHLVQTHFLMFSMVKGTLGAAAGFIISPPSLII